MDPRPKWTWSKSLILYNKGSTLDIIHQKYHALGPYEADHA